MTLRDLLAVFVLEEANFDILHWNSKGRKFDKMHALAEEWAGRCVKAKDTVAEMAMRCGQKPIHYGEAVEILKNPELRVPFRVLTSGNEFEWEGFIKESQFICSSICQSIAAVLDSEEIKKPENVGIKATLEGMYEEWDLDYRYKNPHRAEGSEE